MHHEIFKREQIGGEIVRPELIQLVEVGVHAWHKRLRVLDNRVLLVDHEHAYLLFIKLILPFVMLSWRLEHFIVDILDLDHLGLNKVNYILASVKYLLKGIKTESDVNHLVCHPHIGIDVNR